jgi:hypothetical protein
MVAGLSEEAVVVGLGEAMVTIDKGLTKVRNREAKP